MDRSGHSVTPSCPQTVHMDSQQHPLTTEVLCRGGMVCFPKGLLPCTAGAP